MTDFPTVYPDVNAEHMKYRPCQICGGVPTLVLIQFDEGATEPIVGETLTGATSGDTGVVVETGLLSGAWTGTAAGWIELSDATGTSEDGDWGTADEYLNGSIGGALMLKLYQVGSQIRVGRLYAEGDLVEDDGKWYCKPHFLFKNIPKRRDEWRVEINEGDFD